MNKRYNRILLLLVILSIIATINCVSAIYDADVNITSSDSSEFYVLPNNDNLGDGSQNDLKYAIDHAPEDSTIYLNEGKYAGENNRNISLDKSVTLVGKSKENTVIDCEYSGRLFTMNSNSKLTLINLTLTNGKLNDVGGLIYNDGGQITIQNCILSNSNGYKHGGAIYNNLGTLNIEDSSFINNSAYQYGGVIYTIGQTNIKNSVFTQNFLTAEKGVGGCIAAGGIINLEGCNFSKNFVPYSAAALVRYYAAALLAPPSGQHVITKVYNTIFEQNHAGNHGAVTNNFKDTELFMQNCAIVGNYIIKDKRYGDIV